MQVIMIVTDSEAVPAFERTLAESHAGFTVLPASVGSGRSGFKAGDRVHPGSSSVLFTIVPERDLDPTLAQLRRARDEAGARDVTRMWAFRADEV